MSVTIPTKNINNTQDNIINSNVVKNLEDFNEDYIKLNMGISNEK